MRDKPGVLYGCPYYPTGGKAIGYFAALRMEARLIELIRDSREIVGQVTAVDVRKCKYGPPGMRTAVRLIYGEGLSHTC